MLGALGLGGYLFWLLNGALVKEGNWIGVDFHVYYQIAQVLRRGSDIYSAGISPPYVYPPLLAALVIPLASLPVDAATIIWKLSQHIFLLVAGGLLVNLTPLRIRPLAGGVLLLGLLTVPVQDEIQVGESNSLVLVLIVGAVWLVARNVPTGGAGGPGMAGWLPRREAFTGAAIGAGLLLALAAGIKVLPLVLIAYFWLRGPRAVPAVATGGFILLQLILLLLTPSTVDYWTVQFPGLFGQAFPFLDNQSINATVARAVLPGTDPATPQMNILSAPELRGAITWLLNLLVLAGVVAVLWVGRARRVEQNSQGRTAWLLLEVGLVLLTIHLVSGSTWLHHLIDLGVPLLGLLSVWWLRYEASPNTATVIPPGRSLASGLAVGVVPAALLHRPGDWLTAVNTSMPGAVPLALFASSLGTILVAGLWVVVAVALLGARKS